MIDAPRYYRGNVTGRYPISNALFEKSNARFFQTERYIGRNGSLQISKLRVSSSAFGPEPVKRGDEKTYEVRVLVR